MARSNQPVLASRSPSTAASATVVDASRFAGEAKDVAALVARLEGIPLALELAAARTRAAASPRPRSFRNSRMPDAKMRSSGAPSVRLPTDW